MTAKKWMYLLLVVFGISMICFAGTMYYLDPLLRYGKESESLTYYEYSEMYSNPGIARHYSYDSVMVGTSMIENTDVDLCDELLGTNMIRLPYSGGTSYNMKTILDICFESNNEIKSVYWELDEFQLLNSSTEPIYPLPTYLYESSHVKDLQYLLNLDIFYHYGLKSILGTLQGNVQSAERRGIELYGNFGREQTLASYARPEKSSNVVEFEGSRQQERVQANMENILGLVKKHPETEWNFFMVPFSVLYWDAELRNGTFDVTMECVKYALGELVKYDNVNVYFYHCEEEVITNLDNYKDYSHYGNWINDEITKWIAQEKNLLTQENYVEYIEEMKDYVYSYDFDALF